MFWLPLDHFRVRLFLSKYWETEMLQKRSQYICGNF